VARRAEGDRQGVLTGGKLSTYASFAVERGDPGVKKA
jgi:hypothetical protein